MGITSKAMMRLLLLASIVFVHGELHEVNVLDTSEVNPLFASAQRMHLDDFKMDSSDGDSGSDTMGAVYHMSQSEFRKSHSDFSGHRTQTQKKEAKVFLDKVAAMKSRPTRTDEIKKGEAKENK